MALLYKTCGNCGAGVPVPTTVGGRCPRCHVKFGSERERTVEIGSGGSWREALVRNLNKKWFKWATAPVWVPLGVVAFVIYLPFRAIEKLKRRR